MNDPASIESHLVHLEVIDINGQSHHIKVPDDIGLNVMEACIASGLPLISICGGIALCGGCHSYILSDHILSPISAQEEETLDKLHHVRSNSRLCCQIPVSRQIDGLSLQLAPIE